MSCTFEPVPIPAAGDREAGPELHEALELARRFVVDRYGDDDLAEDVVSTAADLRRQRYVERVLFAARDDSGLVGTLRLDLPRADNTELVEWTAYVAPETDAPRAWGGLLDKARQYAEERGRGLLQGWTSHPPAAARSAVHRPLSGSGFIAADDVAAVLLARGHVLEQVERHSVLDLTELGSKLDALEAPALQAAGEDYRTLAWVGGTPPQWRDSMARLRARMSVDVPTAGLDYQQEAWDAERVRELDGAIAERASTHLLSAVRHVPTDELVAYSVIEVSATRPAAGWQGDTLVHGDHRGHRLGMLVKIANLRSAEAHTPALQRIHTWNAGENAHMLAINGALGFRLRSVEGIWQLRLS